MRKQGLILHIFMYLALSYLQAQNPFIKRFNTSEGLPSDEVNTVCEDQQKFLWIATDGGLVRYDGDEFEQYSISDGLSRNQVMVIKPDSRQRLWFFCIGAQPNYLFQDKIFNNKNSPFLDSLKGTWNFSEDREGNLYFYSYHSGRIRQLDTNNHVKYYSLPSMPLKNDPVTTDGMNIQCLQRKPSGEYLLWTYKGIFKTNDLLKEPVQVATFEGGYHNIFIISDSLVYDAIPTLDPQSWLMVKYCYESVIDTVLFKGAVIDNDCGVKEDPDGRLWITSPVKGIFCLYDHKVIYHLDIQQVYGLNFDHEGNTWVTSQQGAYRISPYALMFNHFDLSYFQNKKIDALTSDPEGRVYGIFNNNLFQYRNNEFIYRDFNYLNHNFIDVDGLENNSLLLTTNQTDYFGVTNILEDPSRKLFNLDSVIPIYMPGGWGTATINRDRDEVCHFDRYNYVVTRYSVEDGFKMIDKETIGPAVDVFYDARDNLVVLGTKEHFILKNGNRIPCSEFKDLPPAIPLAHHIMDHSSDVFLNMYDSLYLVNPQGVYNLSSSYNYNVSTPVNRLTYEDSTLYLATFRNLYLCNKPWAIADEHSVNLRLIDINFRDIRDILVSNDSMYIASDEGLTIIPVNMLGKIMNLIPQPYFRHILVNDSVADTQSERLIIGDRTKISFEFGSIDYSGNPVFFSYMLEGYDDQWNSGIDKRVVYASLPAGQYTFMVRAGKISSPWSAPVEYVFSVRVSFWKHPLFLIAFSLILVGLTSLIVIQRKNVQMRKIEREHQLITLEQKALQSMMNPHFLFNALGSIQHYLLQNKPAEAGMYLSQFARLIRQNMHSVNNPMINLEEETDRLKNYLDLEKMRTKDRFDYRFDIEEGIEEDALLIPTMIIQPFVENSILHGISPLKKDGMILLSFKLITDNAIEIVIEDNGVGIKQSKAFKSDQPGHLHLSIEMTRNRIEILGKKYKVQTLLEVFETNPGDATPGTRVRLVLPVSFVDQNE